MPGTKLFGVVNLFVDKLRVPVEVISTQTIPYRSLPSVDAGTAAIRIVYDVIGEPPFEITLH